MKYYFTFTALLIILKLSGAITISWLMVFLIPFIAPFVFILGVILIFCALAVIAFMVVLIAFLCVTALEKAHK